jgi:hypothetical protein
LAAEWRSYRSSTPVGATARPLKLKQEIELEIAQRFFMEDGAYSQMAMDDLRG